MATPRDPLDVATLQDRLNLAPLQEDPLELPTVKDLMNMATLRDPLDVATLRDHIPVNNSPNSPIVNSGVPKYTNPCVSVDPPGCPLTSGPMKNVNLGFNSVQEKSACKPVDLGVPTRDPIFFEVAAPRQAPNPPLPDHNAKNGSSQVANLDRTDPALNTVSVSSVSPLAANSVKPLGDINSLSRLNFVNFTHSNSLNVCNFVNNVNLNCGRILDRNTVYTPQTNCVIIHIPNSVNIPGLNPVSLNSVNGSTPRSVGSRSKVPKSPPPLCGSLNTTICARNVNSKDKNETSTRIKNCNAKFNQDFSEESWFTEEKPSIFLNASPFSTDDAGSKSKNQNLDEDQGFCPRTPKVTIKRESPALDIDIKEEPLDTLTAILNPAISPIQSALETSIETLGDQAMPAIPNPAISPRQGALETSTTLGDQAMPAILNLAISPRQSAFETRSGTLGDQAMPAIPNPAISPTQGALETRSETLGDQAMPTISNPAISPRQSAILTSTLWNPSNNSSLIQGVACKLCRKTFVSLAYKNLHVKMVHMSSRQLSCPKCTFCANTQSKLLLHMKVHDKHKDKSGVEISNFDKERKEDPKTLQEENKKDRFSHIKILRPRVSRNVKPLAPLPRKPAAKTTELPRKPAAKTTELHETVNKTRPEEKQIECQNNSLPEKKRVKPPKPPRTKKPRYECDFCDDPFFHKFYLSQHIKILHLPKSSPKYACPQCNFTSPFRRFFKIHLSLHDQKKIAPINKSNLKKKFIDTELIPCSQCDYKACSKRNLESHVRVHIPPKSFTCDFCPKKFDTIFNLCGHVARMHPDVTYPCTKCGHVARCSYLLEKHKMVHFSCKNCREMFDTRAQMQEHCDSRHCGSS